MKKTVLKLLGIFSGLALALVILPSIADAHSLQGKASASGCAHLEVFLHGTNPATSTCLDKLQGSGSVTPDTYVTQCGPSSLVIYAGINKSGATR